MISQKRAYLRPYTINIPSGFRPRILNVEGNFFFINESSVVLNVELKGDGEGGIMELKKDQGFRSNISTFRSLEIKRSPNDPNPDADYSVSITAGILPEGMTFFT
jgi:hypothetical protein